jgi:site-specific DNA-methyltransferase (adenine-specific)
MKNKRKEFGEVLTPQSLVDDMLNTLPQEVWTQVDYKWLDPCAGHNGIFPITIYKRLMKTLEEAITDPIARDNHIWDNMIYMVEIQEDSCIQLEKNIIEARKQTLDEYTK